MALQHFYSRVPARMSIFNRTDSFDTFAYSNGLDGEFIEKDLSAIYDNKPSKGDAVLIRNNKLPPVFAQKYSKSGTLMQGCISFLPLDYTGERSAFLVHSLIPDKNEEKLLINDEENNLLNPDMFKTDLSDFDLTSFDATPDCDYPALAYKPCKALNTEFLLSYDSAMMKRLIFCLLNIACGKGKNVFISIPFPISEFSKKSLEFINTLLQIFPYHLRRYFSFVTYTDEAGRFPAFNIRFIPENCPEVPVSKGITLHFHSKIAVGLSDELVASNNFLVEFFYGLLKNDSARREFLKFMDNAVAQVPELAGKMNVKTITELVFLFEAGSGFYNEKTVLPDNQRMFDFVCAYEKHRNALSEEYRAIIFKCLSRYPENHEPIPKDIFSRLSRIYGTEPATSKRVIMNTVLELIHTDVMRDKLFAFIKANYENEDEEMKSIISKDLCRVYYGGFLQSQILSFFEKNFKQEPDDTKDAIVEKLLLTIRTEAVKDHILEFFDNNYSVLTSHQKDLLYSTFYEMLPECDGLSAKMVSLINNNIEVESEQFKEDCGDKIFSLIDMNKRKKDGKLLEIIVSLNGFCADAVVSRLFKGNLKTKLFKDYVVCSYSLPDKQKTMHYSKVFEVNSDMTADNAEYFADILIETDESAASETNLYSLIETEKLLCEKLNGSNAEKLFSKKVLDAIVRPKICEKLTDAFSVKLRRDGLPTVIEYAGDKDFIKSCDGYKYIENYIKMSTSVQNGDLKETVNTCKELMPKTVRLGAAEHLKAELLDGEKLNRSELNESRFLLEVLVEYMKSGEFDFITPYNSLISFISAELKASESKPDIIEQKASKAAMETLVKCADIIYTSAFINEEAKEEFAKVGSTVAKAVTSFISKQKKGSKILNEIFESGNYDETLKEKILLIANNTSASSGGFLKKLFKK